VEVTKRNGKREKVNLNKITERLDKLIKFPTKLKIDPIVVASKVIQGLTDGIDTRELDMLAAQICGTMASHHYDYDELASRIMVSNLHKETEEKFSEKTEALYKIGILNKEYYSFQSITKLYLYILNHYAFTCKQSLP